MKILMIIDGLKMGGTERRMLSLVKKLEETPDIKTEIAVLSKSIHYQSEIESLVSKVHLIERKPKRDPRVFFRIITLCRRFKPDIIHTWGSMPSIYAIPAKTLLNIRLINGMIINAPLRIPFKDYCRAKVSFRFSDRIISNSLAGIGVYKPPAGKTSCIPNGFNPKRIENIGDSGTMRKKLGISTPFVIGMVGRFEKGKDFESFIKCAVKVLEERKDVTFLAIGDGSLLSKLKNSVPPELKDYFIFTGNLQQVESVISLFDIGVLLSTNGEGLSNVIMEYMALEKAVIATKLDGNTEILADGITGFLIPENNIGQITDKINFLLNNPEIRQKMGNNGKNLILSKFSLDNMVESYVQLYHNSI
jgi:glycosyltransferase involved in cell wall biosynthesis